MEYKGILIIILIIAILNCSYADTGPYAGENLGKYVAQDYLNSHNLPYKVTSTTLMYELMNRHNQTKWVSSSQLEDMMKNNETVGESEDIYRTFAGMRMAWKAHVANSQGEIVGSIWVALYNGKIIEIDLPTVSQNNSTNNDNNPNQTISATNTTNPTSQESSNNNNTWIIGAIALVVIAASAGYWFYKKR